MKKRVWRWGRTGMIIIFSLCNCRGYIPAVIRLRKLLRRKGIGGSQVQAQGFWD
jgi:hypothetical protein